jgi:sucrose phosphorylase
MSPVQRIATLLESHYGPAATPALQRRLLEGAPTQAGQPAAPPRGRLPLTERDVLLITYGDQVRTPGEPPLRTLARFCEQHFRGAISGVHLLPHFPSTSDDGFAVTDYLAVDPALGTWDDVAGLGASFDLMFDAVFNHLSASSGWFQRFLAGEPAFRDYFVTVAGRPDLSQVVRPRALPLLTRFASAAGPLEVWTTFSADQVDLNLKNPEVLVALIEVLRFYVARGARFLRLDAIAYLWKEIGTSCIHRPQTHALIQLLRAVLDVLAPQVLLITETNVPHTDNVSYFGDGTNEAQLVYNFALPPLLAHALLRGDATHLARWARSLELPSDQVTFFNFTASHDGIGLNPARGLLPPAEIEFLTERCQAHGGLVSYKHNADGTQSPYELNVTYFDALSDPRAVEAEGMAVRRFLVSQAIMLSLQGLPGIYFHSLVGSRNDVEAARSSGIHRRINRRKFLRADLEAELAEAASLRHRVWAGYRRLLEARRGHPAFAPLARQRVLDLPRSVFGLERATRDGAHRVLALHNLSADRVSCEGWSALAGAEGRWRSLVADQPRSLERPATLEPYEVLWLGSNG